MELELKKDCFDGFDLGTEQVLTQETSAETIVPDYCPDIARIITTEGKVFLHDRSVRDGRMEVSGTVRVSVLYTPDGESGIRTLEFAIPFSADAEDREGCVLLAAEAEMESLESRMLNPRKIFTHCRLILRLTGYRKTPLCCAADVSEESELCLQRLQEQHHVVLLSQIAEKDFTFSGELQIPAGKEAAAEILSSHAAAQATECKLVGSKVIVKGILQVSALYRGTSGQYGYVEGELPFSQILEAEGAAENGDVSVSLQISGADIQLGGEGDDRQIQVTFYLHALALLRREQALTLLSDLYSTAYALTYEAEPVQLIERRDTLVRRQTVREVLETGVTAEELLSVSAACGSVSVLREGDSAVLRTNVLVRVLYLDEGGAALVAERRLEVSCQIDVPEGCRVSAKALCPDGAQGSLGERGIEIRFPVEFRAETTLRRKRICLVSAKVETDKPKDLSAAPSLVLRRLGREETLWMLAKQYSTTIPDILAANGLNDEADVSGEKLLLIPKKRA